MISKDVIRSPVNSGDLFGFFLPHSYRSKSPTSALLACGGGGHADLTVPLVVLLVTLLLRGPPAKVPVVSELEISHFCTSLF